jgi:hypothetical protein
MAKYMLEIAPKLGVYGLRDIRWATHRSWGEALLTDCEVVYRALLEAPSAYGDTISI